MLIAAKLRAGAREGICRIRNVSTGGMMIESRMPLRCDEAVAVELRDRPEVHGLVAWVQDGRCGIRLEAELALDDLLSVAPQRQSRITRTRVARSPRMQVNCRAEVELACGRVEASLLDISQGGARLSMPLVTQRHERLLLMVPGLPMKLGVVRWSGSEVGIAFAQPLSFDLLAEWLLVREGAEVLPVGIEDD